MNDRHRGKFFLLITPSLTIVLFVILAILNQRSVQASDRRPLTNEINLQITGTVVTKTLFVPIVGSVEPGVPFFGFEASRLLGPGIRLMELPRPLLTADSPIFIHGHELKVNLVRMNNRISWRLLQPDQTDPINWSMLTSFENELRNIKSAGMTPIIIADDYPNWATVVPNACSALRSDKFLAFATFMGELANHFKTSEFGVHIWELGNEPDVDPSLVSVDNEFGCWGDKNDPSGGYGGGVYGAMLKVVQPAIKAADPLAQVWIGGLLLASPNTIDSNPSKPEGFLKGILTSGAAPYFDAVPYHWYPSYVQGINTDFDLENNPSWKVWGGGTVGKGKYLQSIMQTFGVNKPVYLNESALGCISDPVKYPYCNPPGNDYFEAQANYLVRTFMRGAANQIPGMVWYTLNGPGWRNTGLLDASQKPRPSFTAYKFLSTQLRGSALIPSPNYGTHIEAYAFHKQNQEIDVLWTISNTTTTVQIPSSKFIAAFNRSGNPITPTLHITTYQLIAGFSPIYVIHKP